MTTFVVNAKPAVSSLFVRLPLILVVAAVVAMLIASRVRAAARAIPPMPPLEIDRNKGETVLTATMNSTSPPLDRVVVSKDSPHARSALFVCDTGYHDVLTALDPGRNADGAAIDLLVQWPGSGGRHSLADILAEENPRSSRLDFRLPGNAKLEQSDDGCIVRVASSSRPNVTQGTAGSSIADRLPRPGTAVVLTLRKRMEEA